MRFRWFLPLLLLTGLTMWPTAFLKAGEGQKKESRAKAPYRVYFIGHSLFGVGNVPAAVQFLSEAANVDRPIKATVYLRGGGTHQNYWETPEVLDRLRKQPWDIVIIAGNCNDMTNPDKVNLEYAKRLDNAAQKTGARVLEYLAWPWVNVSGDHVFEKRIKAQEAFNQPLIRLAKETGVTLVPCGPGLVNVIKKDPKFLADFHYGDVHVSPLGSYFTACVIFASIYDKSPEGLPSTFQEYKIDGKTARVLQASAWETVRQWQGLQKQWKTKSKSPLSASP